MVELGCFGVIHPAFAEVTPVHGVGFPVLQQHGYHISAPVLITNHGPSKLSHLRHLCVAAGELPVAAWLCQDRGAAGCSGEHYML
jgi:hypothetical protein